MWTALFGGVVSAVSGWSERRGKLKALKAEGKLRVQEAKIVAQEARYHAQAMAEGDYDVEAQRQMQYSWKDEYLLFVLTLPMIGSFIPVVQDYVATGWKFLAAVPDWYQWSLIGVISSTFGLRWLFNKANPLKK